MSTPPSSAPRWLLYGASGYTGRLIAEEAVRRGHRPVLAGRSQEKLEPLADKLGLELAVVGLEDVRTLVSDAIAAAVAYLTGGTPEKTTTYNNGKIDVPAKPSAVISVDKANVKAAIIDSGYWPASDFTGLQ